MLVSCDKIEYIPFSLEVSCHYTKKYSVQVIKFTNLKIDNGGDFKIVEGKSYPFLIGLYNQFHSIPDLCGQLEALSEFDKDIYPFFISEGERNGPVAMKDHSIQEFIPYVYSNFYKLQQGKSLDIFSSSIIFKEAYMIVDFHKLVPKNVYIESNSQLPEWYKEEEEYKWKANTACLKIHPIVQQEENQQTFKVISEYSNSYDYFVRYGIERFKQKVLTTLNRKDLKSNGVYISRVNTTKKYTHEYNIELDKEKINVESANITQAYHLFKNRSYEKEIFFEDYFKSIGYQIVYLEELKYKEQLEVLLNTKNIVALHGSGLVNAFICDSDTNIYEIMLPVATNNWWQNFFFFFSPIPGCIDKKNISTSCTKDRRWKQVYNEEYAINIEKWLTT